MILHPANWEVAYDFDVSHFERYPHPKRLTMVEGDAAAQLLTPIVARRWDLYYDENAHRFDVWTWRRHV